MKLFNLFKSKEFKSDITILLYSAGFESTANLIKQLNDYPDEDLYIYYINNNIDYQSVEFEKVKLFLTFWGAKYDINLIKKLNVIFLNLRNDVIDTKTQFLPFRNLIDIILPLTNMGLKIQDKKIKILLGYNKDDNVHDSGDEFVKITSKLLSTMLNNEVKIMSYYNNYSKISMTLDLINKYNITVNELKNNTFSCYNPINGEECNSCKACFRKNVVLYSLNVFRPFHNLPLLEEYINAIKDYDDDRRKSTAKYLSVAMKKLVNQESDL